MKWMAQNWPSLLAVVLAGAIIYILLTPTKAGTVEEYQNGLLRDENTELRAQRDSLQKIVSEPLAPDTHVQDSLAQQSIDLNKQTLYELRKKRDAVIDTLGSTELRRIFAGYQ